MSPPLDLAWTVRIPPRIEQQLWPFVKRYLDALRALFEEEGEERP